MNSASVGKGLQAHRMRVCLLSDDKSGWSPNLTTARRARMLVFRIVNRGPRLRKSRAFIQGADHQRGVTLVVRRIGHETGDIDAARSADQELDGLQRESVAAEQLGIVDGDAQRTIGIGDRPRLMLTAKRALTGTGLRIFRRDAGFVLDLDVLAVAAAGQLGHEIRPVVSAAIR